MKRLLACCLLCSLLLCAAPAVSQADRYEQVKSDLQSGRMDAAYKSLNSMVREQPDDYQAWFLLGVANARQHRLHQAIEAFRRVVELNPELAEPHNNLAVIYNELGDVHAAVAELEQSLKKRPGYVIAEENIADLYVKLALKHYRNALAKEPTPSLEQRYMRLLQVRDPAAMSGGAETEVAAITAPSAGREVVKEPAQESVEPAVAGTAEEEKEAVTSLPEKLPVIDVAKETGEQAQDELVKKDILAVVEKWRSAWSARDLEGYFAAYAADFRVPARFASMAEWKRYKRRVIGSKKWIEIEITDAQVEIEADSRTAKVKFFQKFRSNSYNGDDHKVLELRFGPDGWKIVNEVSV